MVSHDPRLEAIVLEKFDGQHLVQGKEEEGEEEEEGEKGEEEEGEEEEEKRRRRRRIEEEKMMENVRWEHTSLLTCIYHAVLTHACLYSCICPGPAPSAIAEWNVHPPPPMDSPPS